MLVTHPACKKQFPANNTHGHCSGCCETFVGLTSFDAHRVGTHDTDRRCEIQPYETKTENGTRYGHWQDKHGYWKYGKQLTEQERATLIQSLSGQHSSA